MNTPVVLRVPTSKSVTHRAFVLAARSAVPCVVKHPLMGADCLATLSALGALGARFRVEPSAVHFQPISAWTAPASPLRCENSGTTLRLMCGQAATANFEVTLTGDASLQGRPNGPLLAALGELGVHTAAGPKGKAPLTVRGPLHPGRVTLPPRTSSQYASALILGAALGPSGTSHIELPPPVASRPYLDLTLSVARAFGLQITQTEGQSLVFEVPGEQRPSAPEFAVEGDWSGAAFPLVAAAILGRPVSLLGLRQDSKQGDKVVVSLLRRFGLQIHWQDQALHLEPAPLLGAGEIDLGAAPDLFPALVALAACAQGETRFVNAPSLRHKECDRIEAMATGIASLGVEVSPRPDGLVVRGGPLLPSGAVIATHHDHRVHMAFAILAARTSGITVNSRGCEAVSYPKFYEDLTQLQPSGEVAGQRGSATPQPIPPRPVQHRRS